MRLIRFMFIMLLGLPFAALGQNGYDYQPTLDTITDTEQDTVTSFTKRVYQPHTVGLQCAFSELSGTSNITVYLEGSNSPAGTPWHVIANDTIPDGANSATLYLVKPSSAQNFIRYRYRVSGDSGATQSQQYHCVLATKEDN